MKKALISGVSSGIGRSIAKELAKSGYFIYGISRQKLCDTESIKYLKCDLSDPKNLNQLIDEIEDIDFDLLINSAGFGIFAPHEEISIDKISSLIDVNLKSPILLSSVLLRGLKKNRGVIINISSIEATRSSRFSALYSATKSGLRAFSLALFEEVRKSGVNVVNINPDMCDTQFFDELNFEPLRDGKSCIDPQAIADFVMYIIKSKESFIISDVTLRQERIEIIKKAKIR